MEFLNKKEGIENEEKGLNIKNHLTLITRIIGHAIFPIIIMVSLYIAQHFFAGFWGEVLMVVGVTTLAMLILHSNDVVRENDDVVQVLRDSLVIGTGSVLLTKVIDHYFVGQNTFGPVPMVISILLVVFGLLLTSFSDPYRCYQNKTYQKVCNILAKIVSTFVTVWLLSSIYKVAGTQYIWLPAISLWVFWFYFSYDNDLNREFGNHEEIILGSTIILFTICLISTLCEFWLSTIVFGFNLWQCLLGVSILAIVIISLVFYKKHKDEKLAEKISAEKKEADKAKKREADILVEQKNVKVMNERLVKLESATKAIKAGSEPKWSDILFVDFCHNQNIHKLSDILPKIHQAPLAQLIKVSKIKKQIAFNASDLKQALEIINKFTEKYYDDEILQGFINQVIEFLDFIREFNSFTGYQRVLDEVVKHCPKVYELIPNKKIDQIVTVKK